MFVLEGLSDLLEFVGTAFAFWSQISPTRSSGKFIVFLVFLALRAASHFLLYTDYHIFGREIDSLDFKIQREIVGPPDLWFRLFVGWFGCWFV